MVEFEVIQNQDPGAVMNEFAAFVEEGGVVFVPLDDKGGFEASGFIATGQIQGHAPDQIPRVGFQFPQSMRGEGGGRGLAVGARHHHRNPPSDQVFPDHLRQGGEGKVTGSKQVLDLRIPPGNRVTHHHAVGVPFP